MIDCSVVNYIRSHSDPARWLYCYNRGPKKPDVNAIRVGIAPTRECYDSGAVSNSVDVHANRIPGRLLDAEGHTVDYRRVTSSEIQGETMHVVAFAPSLRAVLDEGGGVTADGFPLTSCTVASFPAQITIPVVIAVYTQGGTDYDPRRYLVATSPERERLSTLECAWHWPDKPGAPVKFWVMTRNLPMVVQTAGVYTIGLYDSPDGTETDHLFPLPVAKANPFAASAPQPTTPM